MTVMSIWETFFQDYSLQYYPYDIAFIHIFLNESRIPEKTMSLKLLSPFEIYMAFEREWKKIPQ